MNNTNQIDFLYSKVTGVTELENVSLLLGDAKISQELGKLNLSSGRCSLGRLDLSLQEGEQPWQA